MTGYIERTFFDELRDQAMPRAAPQPEPDPDDELSPSERAWWERQKAWLECDRPIWVVNRHPADGRALPGWSWCSECPRCEATMDENGEKP